MTAYVLVLLMRAGVDGGVHTHSVDFHDRASCEHALSDLRSQHDAAYRSGFLRFPFIAGCYPRGTK